MRNTSKKRRLIGVDVKESSPEGTLIGSSSELAQPKSLIGESDTSNVIQLPTSLSAPLALPAVTASLATRGLRIQAARRKSLYDNRPSVVGMRTMFTLDFYDIVTKEQVTPTSVNVVATNGATTTTISMVETTGRTGHFTGSFVPSVSGEWLAVARHGGANGEIVDSANFYVIAEG